MSICGHHWNARCEIQPPSRHGTRRRMQSAPRHLPLLPINRHGVGKGAWLASISLPSLHPICEGTFPKPTPTSLWGLAIQPCALHGRI